MPKPAKQSYTEHDCSPEALLERIRALETAIKAKAPKAPKATAPAAK